MAHPASKSRVNIADLAKSGTTDTDKREAVASIKEADDYEFDLCAQDFWRFCTYVITDDEDQKKKRHFPSDYESLHRLQDLAENNQKVIILKSRRLLASWWMVLRQLHQAMFAGTRYGKEVFSGGIGSIGQTEAEYLMRRIATVHSRLPDWMKLRNPILRDNQMFMEWTKGGKIQAFPLKREGPQTFGFSEFSFDEMALQEAVRTAWAGLIPTLGADGKLIAVSTPNGKGNLFHDIWVNKEGNYNGIVREKLHWRENPEHDEKWFKATTDSMDPQMIARMFELSFAAYLGTPVWGAFDRKTHIVETTEVDENKPMLIGWDFGYHFPAVVFAQRNSRDQLVGHREFLRFDIPFDKFCTEVLEFMHTFYDRDKVNEIFCVPEDGKQSYRTRSQSGARNDIDQIKKTFAKRGKKPQVRVGPQQVGTRDNEGPRMKETRILFNLRRDGEPGAYFNEGMTQFLEGCQGGYSYPEKGGEEPMKNEYGHVQDAYQALVVVLNRIINPDGHKRQPDAKLRSRIGVAGL